MPCFTTHLEQEVLLDRAAQRVDVLRVLLEQAGVLAARALDLLLARRHEPVTAEPHGKALSQLERQWKHNRKAVPHNSRLLGLGHEHRELLGRARQTDSRRFFRRSPQLDRA
eukprot:SAG22_NODE_991_length_6129_cov_8.370813_11_plen_112_part_00